MPVAEKEQNIRSLSDDPPACLEERRRKRQLTAFPSGEKAHQPGDTQSPAFLTGQAEYSLPASSRARRTNSPLPWIVGQ